MLETYQTVDQLLLNIEPRAFEASLLAFTKRNSVDQSFINSQLTSYVGDLILAQHTMLQHAKGTAYDLRPDICHALGIETFRRELVEILFKHGQPSASQLFVVVEILLQVAFVRHQLVNRVPC